MTETTTGFYQDLFLYLQTQTGITELVGDRIHPLKLPQEPTLPAIVYQLISGPRVYSQSGDSHLANPRFQFRTWSESYAQAVQIALEIRKALSGFKGKMNNRQVHAGFIDNEIADNDPETDLYSQIVDVIFWIKD